jgi:hypothetical protein
VILIVCRKCGCGLRISPGQVGDVSESENLFGRGSTLYPDKYPCFRCEQPSEFVPAAEAEALRAIELFDVTPQEALAAMNGLGLPSEQDCSASAVVELFTKPVRRVHARPIRNSHRCLLDHIEFEDGTKLYLGSSAHGATVYRIARPHSYVKEVSR